jgi:beta-glucosidase
MAFPEGFWWGSGASATQTEGAPEGSTWRAWEKAGHAPPSGDGNGFATRYAEDFRLFAEHGLTQHRISLEWARLEPRPGAHDPHAVEHYTEMLRSARAAGIDVWVCLHHFTLPGWFADDEGGFLDERARSYFWARHVDWVGETFGDLVRGWKPINEPVFYALGGFLLGFLPPGRHERMTFEHALEAIHLASFDAARLLRSGGQPVATIDGMMPMFPATRTRDPAEREQATTVARRNEDLFWCGLRAQRDGVLAVPGRAPIEVPHAVDAYDLIGFSYYAAQSVYADGSLGPYPADAVPGPMGYVPWPEGLALSIRKLADELPGRPILIDECGLGTAADRPQDDDRRVTYVNECIHHVENALADGIDVRGFFHWTAIDNYEWSHAFDVQFGLFDRDRNAKPSAALARRYALGSAS